MCATTPREKVCRHACWYRCDKSTRAREQHGSVRILTRCMLAEIKLHDGHADKIISIRYSFSANKRSWQQLVLCCNTAWLSCSCYLYCVASIAIASVGEWIQGILGGIWGSNGTYLTHSSTTALEIDHFTTTSIERTVAGLLQGMAEMDSKVLLLAPDLTGLKFCHNFQFVPLLL